MSALAGICCSGIPKRACECECVGRVFVGALPFPGGGALRQYRNEQRQQWKLRGAGWRARDCAATGKAFARRWGHGCAVHRCAGHERSEMSVQHAHMHTGRTNRRLPPGARRLNASYDAGVLSAASGAAASPGAEASWPGSPSQAAPMPSPSHAS